MKNVKCVLSEMVLPLIVAWFFMTLLVDIVAIPTVFKNISNLQEGGKIGMLLFGKFNYMEMFMSAMILLGIFSMQKKSKLLIFIAIVLLAFSLLYTFCMTPMIGNTSTQLYLVKATDPQYEILRKQHQLYHEAYRSLDTVKLFILLLFAGLMMKINMKRI